MSPFVSELQREEMAERLAVAVCVIAARDQMNPAKSEAFEIVLLSMAERQK